LLNVYFKTVGKAKRVLDTAPDVFEKIGTVNEKGKEFTSSLRDKAKRTSACFFLEPSRYLLDVRFRTEVPSEPLVRLRLRVARLSAWKGSAWLGFDQYRKPLSALGNDPVRNEGKDV
jgi:hypothetical protein